MSYPVAVERIHGAEPASLNRSEPVFCFCGCGQPAQVLIRWESHTGKADGWYSVACARKIGAVA